MWTKNWRLMAEAEDGVEGSAPPVAQESEGSSADSSIWDDLLDDGADEALPVEEPTPEAQPEVVEVSGEAEKPAEVVSVALAPAVAVAEAAPIVEKPVEVAQPPAAPVVSQEPTQYVPTPEERAFLHKQAIEGLATRYTLSEEDATALQVEPEKVLPRLAANVHAAIYDDVLRRVYAEAPALIERSLRQQTETQRAEEAFYGRWADLRGHTAEVERVAVMWRQMYPQATLEQAIEGIGTAAKALLGLGGAAAPAPMEAPRAPPPPPAGPSSRVGIQPPSRSRLSVEEQAFADFSKTFEEEI